MLILKKIKGVKSLGEEYFALYRKYRPRKFCDVVGQENIVKTLVNQIKLNRISHAYLFCGTRGTGKTSVAKIFAMALNCLDNKKNNLAEPCFSCTSCQDILNKKDMNVIEIDAASNNGVDNIREIRDEVKYPPVNAKYKIYIIDEVHMLSSGAFNALLKTLEEPPEHVIFILATTEPQKIPVTIISRCQRFDFKRIKKDKMFAAIKKYMVEEKINIDDDAINYVIYLSDGAMRDALSILDQVIAFYFDEKIDLKKVIEITGAADDSFCCEFLNCFREKNLNKILEMINKIVFDGKEISQFVYNLVLFLRDKLVLMNSKDDGEILNLWEERLNNLNRCNLDFDLQMDLLKMFLELLSELKYAIDEKIALEAKCIKFLFEKKNVDGFEKKEPEKKVLNKENVKPEEKNNRENDVVDKKKLDDVLKKIVLNADGLLKEILIGAKIIDVKENIIYIKAENESKRKLLDERKAKIKNLLEDEIDLMNLDLKFVCEKKNNSEQKSFFDEKEFDAKIKKINMDVKIED